MSTALTVTSLTSRQKAAVLLVALGQQAAARLLYTSEWVSAEDAWAMGLALRVSAPGATALTVTPYRRSSRAAMIVKAAIPIFAAP